MTLPRMTSGGSMLARMWSRWSSFVKWTGSLARRVAARCGGRTAAGLSPATGERRFLFLALVDRSRMLFGDFVIRLWGGRRLDSRQRLFLLREYRLELDGEVQDAENHALSDEDARRISLTRSLIRWLERGELPGPDVIPHLETSSPASLVGPSHTKASSGRRSSPRSTSSAATAAPLPGSTGSLIPNLLADSGGPFIGI